MGSTGVNILYYSEALKIYVRETRRGHQKWTIQRNWQHWVHKIHDEDKPNKKYHTED